MRLCEEDIKIHVTFLIRVLILLAKEITFYQKRKGVYGDPVSTMCLILCVSHIQTQLSRPIVSVALTVTYQVLFHPNFNHP